MTGRMAGNSWRNWAGDQSCTPAEVLRPRSVAEVAQAVERASANRWTVRVAGAGHSFTDAVLTNGMLLSLDRMNRVLDVDRSSGLVRVEAGITLHELSPKLEAHGLAVENLGDIDVQSVAGAISTGTHGTGARLRNIPSGIRSVQLVRGDGTTLECSADDDPDAWRAARVSIGALGVITEVTLQAVPAFTLRGVDGQEPLETTLDRLDELADGNDHFEFFAFPHSPLALTRRNNRVDLPPAPPSRLSSYVTDILLTNHVFGLLCRTGRRFPGQIPRINRLVSRLAGSRIRVDASYRIFANPRRVRFTEMEYAIPRTHGAAAVRAVFQTIAEHAFDVPFPIEVRFVRGDDAFLSPANGRDTCYIAVHMFEVMAWEPYFRAVEEIMNGFDGRPHWGKRHFQTPETLRARYPQWDSFAAVRARLDPDGRFANRYVQRVLGPVTSPVVA